MYTPDLSRPAVIRITDDSYNTRLTWQATQKHKIAVFADFQPHIVYQRGYQVPTSPEATAYAPYLPNAFLVATWKGVLTNHLIVDVKSTHNSIDSNQRRQPGVGFDIVSAAETSTGVTFRSLSGVFTNDFNYSHRSNSGFRSSATLTYVTGSQTAKIGMQHVHGFELYTNEVNGDLAYSLRSGVPTSITEALGLIQSGCTNPARPMAATRISARRIISGKSRDLEWQMVTVAFAWSSSSAIGLPTISLRPSTTAFAPSIAI